MKIGVLTFHRCINYGSYWQARCLRDGLAAEGHEAVLLDHRSPRIDRAEWRCALEPLQPRRVPTDRPLYARKARRFFEAFDSLPCTPPFALEQAPVLDGLDAVVVGSDEVWNFHHPWYAAQPLFFGAGLQGPRLIAFAASFGNYPAEGGIDAGWAQRLRAFHHLSVRDQNSRRLVEQATGTPSPLVLDPCLQFGPAPMERVDDGPAGQGRPYAAVYGHGFSARFAEHARHWARRRGLRLVSIGYRNDWADEQWLTAGPLEFAAFMEGAQAVLTNFFHGCVFALRLAKPFMTEYSPYRSIKIHDLLTDLDCAAHVFGDAAAPGCFDAGLDRPLASAVEARLATRRAMTHAYLDRALSAEAVSRREPDHAVG